MSLAERLADAIRDRRAIEPPDDDLSIDDAYDAQDELLKLLGGEVVAAKLGLTSRAKQEQMNVGEPIYGWLTDVMGLDAGEPVPCAELIQPRVEPEIAFLIRDELRGRGVTAARVLAATEAVLPALDVLDSRFTGYRFTLPSVIADDASAGRFRLGNPIALERGTDLRLVGCVFEKNGEVVATAAGAAVLDHPAAAVAWFVRKLAERSRALPARTIVLAGALTAAVAIEPGDVVGASFDRIGSVELACR
ncbi:MAG: 2-keto-4-pentenoate hydratase [Acidimicrobiales bacterium]